jgi:hypothetical protein
MLDCVYVESVKSSDELIELMFEVMAVAVSTLLLHRELCH